MSAESFRGIAFMGKFLRVRLLSTTAIGLACAVWSAEPAFAADLAIVEPALKPAVDAVNGKLEGFGGWADGRFGRKGDFSGGGLGSVTFPLGPTLGAQFDGLAAIQDGDFVGGGAAHLFTRDPDRYLLGVYGSAVGFENRAGAWNGKIGVEGEAYFDRLTISGVAGYEHVWGGSNSFERIRRGGSFFDYVDVSYYLTDDWKVSVGHRYTGRRNAAAFGTEFRLPFQGLDVSAFAEGRVGEHDYKAVWAGLKFYFGSTPKSLIARHRESDPSNWLKDDLFSVSSRRKAGGTVPPPPPPPCGCGGPCGYD
ncbi:hypothetical protein [Hansschlegelia plantiphila]|uniref:Porin family protein n=1 Tax=Hansschlegelia plantiphila TaxID=374655 RepID=A0A9W6J1A9_9HYPH|nr:hypothetical protein [Hansschlegelia plantiphila]GLK67893.1 hypothetical protein GCM10008179_15310 [Hansschlegelia plantiphila]